MKMTVPYHTGTLHSDNVVQMLLANLFKDITLACTLFMITHSTINNVDIPASSPDLVIRDVRFGVWCLSALSQSEYSPYSGCRYKMQSVKSINEPQRDYGLFHQRAEQVTMAARPENIGIKAIEIYFPSQVGSILTMNEN